MPQPSRPWQRRAAIYLRNKFAARKLIQAPTGSGKSRVLRDYAYEQIEARRKVVIAVPSVEIARQFRSDVLSESGLRPGWDVGGEAAYLPAHELVITTHAAFWRRVDAYQPAHLWEVIFDECHHGNEEAPANVGALAPFRHVTGASASPWTPRCSAIFGGGKPFIYPLSQAIADGCVSPYEIHEGPPPAELPPGKVLRFVRTLKEVEAGRGVHSKMDAATRRRRVAAYRMAGEAITAKRCLLEGFDDPEIRHVVIEASSRSEVSLYQMMGRGLRYVDRKIAHIWISTKSHKYLLSALLKAK